VAASVLRTTTLLGVARAVTLSPSHGDGQGGASPPYVSGRMQALTPRGQAPRRLSVRLNVRQGWHIGARQAGRGSLPTRIAWELPSGWTVASERWPQPSRLAVAGDTLAAFSGAVSIEAVLVRSPSAKVGPIRAVVTFGACRDMCVPGRLALALDP